YGDNLFMRGSFLAGTCLPAMLLFYMATEIFFNIRAAKQVPPDLADILVSVNTPRQQCVEDVEVTCGSGLSSIPITAVTLMYPVPGTPIFVTYLLASLTAVVNTLLHFLPIELVINDTKLIYQVMEESRLKPKEKQALLREKAIAGIYGEFKG